MDKKTFKPSKICSNKPKPKQATIITRTVSLAFKRIDDFEGWRHNDPSRNVDKPESGDNSPAAGTDSANSADSTSQSQKTGDQDEADDKDEDDGSYRYVDKQREMDEPCSHGSHHSQDTGTWENNECTEYHCGESSGEMEFIDTDESSDHSNNSDPHAADEQTRSKNKVTFKENKGQLQNSDSDNDDGSITDVSSIQPLLDLQQQHSSSVASIHINCEILKIETKSMCDSRQLKNLVTKAKPTGNVMKQSKKPTNGTVLPHTYAKNAQFTTIYGDKTPYKKPHRAAQCKNTPTTLRRLGTMPITTKSNAVKDGFKDAACKSRIKVNSVYAPALKRPLNKRNAEQSPIVGRHSRGKPKVISSSAKTDTSAKKEPTTKHPQNVATHTAKTLPNKAVYTSKVSQTSKNITPLLTASTRIQASSIEILDAATSAEGVYNDLDSVRMTRKRKPGWLNKECLDPTSDRPSKIPEPIGNWSEYIPPRTAVDPSLRKHTPCGENEQETCTPMPEKAELEHHENSNVEIPEKPKMEVPNNLKVELENHENSNVEIPEKPKMEVPNNLKVDKTENAEMIDSELTHSQNPKCNGLKELNRKPNIKRILQLKPIHNRLTPSPRGRRAKRKPPIPTFRKQKMPKTSRNCNIMPRLSMTSICKKNRRKPLLPLWERVHTEAVEDMPKWKRQQLLCLRATIEEGLTGEQANRLAKLATLDVEHEAVENNI